MVYITSVIILLMGQTHHPNTDRVNRCPSETDFNTDRELTGSSRIKLLQESTSMKVLICKLSIQFPPNPHHVSSQWQYSM